MDDGGEGATESRRRVRHLRVPVTPEEGQAISHLANETGLSIAAYLRLVGIGH